MEIAHNFWDSVEGWAGNGGVGEVGGGIVGTKISELLIFAHFLFFGERCECIAHLAQIK